MGDLCPALQTRRTSTPVRKAHYRVNQNTLNSATNTHSLTGIKILAKARGDIVHTPPLFPRRQAQNSINKNHDLSEQMDY